MSVALVALVLLAALVPGAIAQPAAAGPVAAAQARRVFPKQPSGAPATKLKSFFRQAQEGPSAPGQVYVRFRAEASPEQRQAAHALARMNREERPFGHYLPDTVLVRVAPGQERAAINAYLDNPDVIYAEPVHLSARTAAPNDTWWLRVWGMHKIRAPDAWDVTTGDPDFKIGVVDSGLNFTHTDIATNVWTNPGEIPGNGKDDDNNGFKDDVRGWNFAKNSNDISDDPGSNFHGTHVSGTIGAVGNNAAGVVGVNWRCKIVMAACANPVTGNLINTESGLAYLLTNGVKVSNHSYGSYSYSQTGFDMFERARQEGHIAVCAASNDDSDNDAQPYYPASYALDNIIAVASHDEFFSLVSTFSNYGATSVDIAAPGSGIVSTAGLPDLLATKNGTSMASPHVAGVVALVWSKYPDLTWEEVRARVLTGGISESSLNGKVSSGSRLDAARPMGVWVRYGDVGLWGTRASPSPNIPNALPLVPYFGHLFVRGPSAPFSGRIGDKPMRIESYDGVVRIGP